MIFKFFNTCLLWGALLLWSLIPSLHAQDIVVHFETERIEINMDITVNAPLNQVAQIVYDYDNLGTFFPLISRSHLIRELGNGLSRVRADLKGCILNICREIRHVMDVQRAEQGWNMAKTVRAHSDIRASELIWRIEEVSASHTRLQLLGWVELGRRIPPLIGRPLIRREIHQQLSQATLRLEKAAREVAP